MEELQQCNRNKAQAERQIEHGEENQERLKLELKGESILAEEEIKELQAAKQQLADRLAAERAAAARAKSVYDNLVSDLKSEIAVNRITVSLMKSGVNVVLPSEVLFPSGSTELKDDGKNVLMKVGSDLRDVPYQIVVAGFTDNVSIGPALSAQYPTNWELSGARAARVVRILEEVGVPSGRLLAVGFGETRPAAGNDTPQGRAKNRRIEIRLRPVEVEN
jgi:chemotaxis protein MotB